ncbi:MAG: hypothetical protein U0P30_15390 [Vicinamibacterales bacterium]
MTARRFVAAVLLCGVVVAPAAAQSTASLRAAVDLYASASYDDALVMLDALRTQELDSAAIAQVEQHRMLCLVALGRPREAELAAAALLGAAPATTLDASAVSPRVRALFDTTRRRVLPTLARQRYAEAKRAYDAGDYGHARDGFDSLEAMLATPDVDALDPTLADLRTLTEGFGQLASAAFDRASSSRRDLETVRAAMAALRDPQPVTTMLGGFPPVSAEADAPLVPPAPVAAAAIAPPAVALADATADTAATPAAPAPFSPLDIFTYDWRDKDVVAPTPVAQPIDGWWGAMGEPAAGTRLGVVDLVVDEQGHVADAYIYQSVNRVYDAVLLASVKHWQFRPATRGGRAVKYRRLTGVVSQR